MTEQPFHTSRNPRSGRTVILEDDGCSAFLYLTAPESLDVEADVWVYNRVEAPEPDEIESYRPNPPPASSAFAAPGARCENPEKHSWFFEWNDRGDAVALLRDGEPTAFLVAGARHGWSRLLTVDCPWGNAWDAGAYEATFGEGDAK